MATTTSTQSNTSVLGATMSYDSMLAIEGLLLINPILDVIRKAGFKPNKSNLVKMSLIYFLSSDLTKERILELYEMSDDDTKFQQALVGKGASNE